MTPTPATSTTADPAAPAADLDPHGEMLRRLAPLRGAESWDDVPPAAREAWEAPYGPAESLDLRIEEREARGPHGIVPLRVYSPAVRSRRPRPALVWCHGGSFQHGDLDMPEAHETARRIAARADAVVVSVDYRLCDEPAETGGAPARRLPGETFTVHAPIPGDDVMAAVRWTRSMARLLGIDPARVALGGASAGGNLAASASLRLAEAGEAPAASLLMYPVTHPLNPEPTAEEAAALAEVPGMFRFPPANMRRMAEAYLGHPLEQATAHEFPGLGTAEQLAVLPRTYLEADEYDDLRLGARRYAEQLAAADVDVRYEVRRGVTHGHLNKLGLPQAAESCEAMAQILREL
jgi:acetyl esterase